MLYTLERYPVEMNQLPEEVKRKAIKITNDMMNDGDVRYHKDFIIILAIEEAKRWEMSKNKPQAN